MVHLLQHSTLMVTIKGPWHEYCSCCLMYINISRDVDLRQSCHYNMEFNLICNSSFLSQCQVASTVPLPET